jgi:hypothetical protein
MTFRTEEDLMALLGPSMAGHSIGIYVDLVGVLTRLEDTFADGKTYTDKTRSAKLCDLTPLAADQMASLDFPTVLFLFEKTPGKKVPVDEDEGWGHRLESFDRYTGAKGKCVRTDITTRTRTLTTKIKGAIIGSGPAQRLARHLSSEVNRQVAAFTNFLTEYEGELEHECNYPAKVAWNYLGVCARAIIKHLVVPRIVGNMHFVLNA